MKIESNYNSSKLNTFGIDVNAKFFVEVENERDLTELFPLPEFKNNPKLFLGGGSNILLTKDFGGIAVLNKLKGIEILEENKESILVKAMGGEVWHDLVNFAVSRNYWGIENLSSIPGSVGAAPVQNIGAYGTDLKEVLEYVEAFNVETGEKKVFTNDTYKKGYRESIFKNEFKGKYFISAVVLRLSKLEKKNLNYRSLREYLEKNKIEIKGPREISEAVTEIRKEKLPDPKIISNAGSFFINVLVDQSKLKEMLKIYPSMPYFKDGTMIKIPSGWLIEECGWKGKRFGDAGVYKNHALVLVNHGSATGIEIKELAEKISASVFDKFELKLVYEVNLI